MTSKGMYNRETLITVPPARAVARTLIGRVFIYIFMFCPKETSRAEHEYMNKHPPPINVLATAVPPAKNYTIHYGIL